MLQIQTCAVTPFAQNCAVVWCDQTQQCLIVDPGGDNEKIKQIIEAHKLAPKQIVLTHGHLDHVGGAVEMATRYQIPIIGPHQDDRFWLENLPMQSQQFGFPMAKAFAPDQWLEQGDVINIGQSQLHVRHCPGHTPGHVVLIAHDARWVITADVLFRGSVGRTDFPRGDAMALEQSIREQLYTLPDDYQVYPGHGPTTTIGNEKRSNSFIRS